MLTATRAREQGFCGSCNLEVQLTFAAFTIRACDDFASSLAQVCTHTKHQMICYVWCILL